MNIAFLQTKDWEEEYIKEKFQSIQDVDALDFYKDPVDVIESANLEKYDIISSFIHSPFSYDLFQKLPNLKMIGTRSTGFDHIDLSAAEKQGVVVSNVPGYGVNTVAEHTFALLLSISRKIPQSINQTQRNNFDRDGLQGFDLAGKTIGIIGTGRIGYHVVKIASGFGMNVVAYDPYPNKKLVEEFGVSYLSLDELLQQSDIITLHVPYMKETHHIINTDNIKNIKKGTILINTARGALVDNEALIDALQDGILAGAGLDVLEGEELIEDEMELLDQEVSKDTLETLLEGHVLMSMDNVIITPHNAFNTREAIMRIIDTTIDNIIAFINGKPTNVVKRKNNYVKTSK